MTTNCSSKLQETGRNTVPFLDLRARYREMKEEYDDAYHRVMDSNSYILGRELESFESEFAAYCGAAETVGVGSGMDALVLILRACGIGRGHEVLVPANTFIATWLAVTHTGARPIPVEPLPDTCNLDPARIEAALTRRTRAIIAVHLYGQPARMDAIQAVAQRHGLRLIEDAAQAHGASWHGQPAGTLADAAAFSFYPTKNLGAFGDGGAVVSNDRLLAGRVRLLRNYGSGSKDHYEVHGFNSRLDPLQAAFLRVGLRHLDRWNARREAIAGAYLDGLAGVPGLVLPAVAGGAKPVWHLFVVRQSDRDALRQRLESRGIQTAVHYPVPPHLTEAYAQLGYRRGDLPVTESLSGTVLSLPLNPHLDAAGVERVIQAVRDSETSHG